MKIFDYYNNIAKCKNTNTNNTNTNTTTTTNTTNNKNNNKKNSHQAMNLINKNKNKNNSSHILVNNPNLRKSNKTQSESTLRSNKEEVQELKKIKLNMNNFITYSTIKPFYLYTIKASKFVSFILLGSGVYLYNKAFTSTNTNNTNSTITSNLTDNIKNTSNNPIDDIFDLNQNTESNYASKQKIYTFTIGSLLTLSSYFLFNIFKNFVVKSSYSEKDEIFILTKLNFKGGEYSIVEDSTDLRFINKSLFKPFANMKNRKTTKHYSIKKFHSVLHSDISILDILGDRVSEIKSNSDKHIKTDENIKINKSIHKRNHAMMNKIKYGGLFTSVVLLSCIVYTVKNFNKEVNDVVESNKNH